MTDSFPSPAGETAEVQASASALSPLRQLDGKISFWAGIPFGIQHVLAMFVANLTPIAIVAAAAGMNSEYTAWIISSALLVAGLGTCLQLYPLWRIGGRLPIVTGISFTYVARSYRHRSEPKARIWRCPRRRHRGRFPRAHPRTYCAVLEAFH